MKLLLDLLDALLEFLSVRLVRFAQGLILLLVQATLRFQALFEPTAIELCFVALSGQPLDQIALLDDRGVQAFGVLASVAL